MRQHIAIVTLLILLLPALAADAPATAPPSIVPPSIAYGGLYGAVEMAGLYPDQKSFADAIGREPASAIMADYGLEKSRPGFSLSTFVARHFTFRRVADVSVPPIHNQARQDVHACIRDMWRILRRPPDKAEPH